MYNINDIETNSLKDCLYQIVIKAYRVDGDKGQGVTRDRGETRVDGVGVEGKLCAMVVGSGGSEAKPGRGF